MSAIDRAVETAGGQKKLADQIGVSQGAISMWVSGQTLISIEHFPNIQKATGVTVYELLDDELKKLKELKRNGTR